MALLGQRTYTSVALDFGPASVEGWLAGLVAAGLGLAPSVVIDRDARELRLGRRLRLTPLEFGVLSCLQQHERRAVSRGMLLEAMALETIRGTGYRLSIN